MGKEKWYSHGLSGREISGLQKQYAKIRGVHYSDLDGERLLCFGLVLEDGFWAGCNLAPDDAKQILERTRIRSISDLDGKVIEAYLQTEPGRFSLVRGVSVNENLI